MNIKHSLRIPPGKLRWYQERYDFSTEANLDKYQQIGPKQGYLTVSQLHEICRWKSRRRADLALSNSEALVREITAFSFTAKCEESRLGALTLLSGVQCPTASVILHFCVDQSYPILDFRAIWSLGVKQPSQYTVAFWKEYVRLCRAVAAKHRLTIRELDMALWQYSSEHQGG
ncbi:MAG TPA: hypothetical protein VJ646_03415 [Candidatus Binatia bacterium]|nr:hypothetical protein [Candidatus Binatia bacterium]